MVDKNPTPEYEIKEFQAGAKERMEKIDQSYAEYRKSGLALMSTIIGLSTGILYITKNLEHKIPFSWFFSLPIVVALIQELFHYLGSMYEARGRFSLYMFLLSCALKLDDANKYATENESYAKLKNRYFSAADWLCVAAVILFVFAFTVYITPLEHIVEIVRHLCYTY